MHKLRMTWTPWFYWTTLNELDKRINKIDKAWPIIAKKDQVQARNPTPPVQQPPPTAGLAERKKFREKLSNSQVENGQLRPKVVDTKPPTTPGRPNIHVNPNFLEGRQLSVSEDSQTEDDELKAMEEKIQKLRQKKAEAAKKKEEERKKQQRKKELEAILEQERLELERIEKGEPEVSKITTSGSKSSSSKDSSLNSSSSSSTSSSSKASNAKVSTSGTSSKKDRDPRKKDRNPQELAKILEAKTEEAKKESLKRAQSRSPTRQSPTTTSGGGNTPPSQGTAARNERSLDFFIIFDCKLALLRSTGASFSRKGLFTPSEVSNGRMPPSSSGSVLALV